MSTVTHNLTVRSYVALLFVQNETCTTKMVDEEIEEVVRHYFSDDKEVLHSLDFMGPFTARSRIRIWRSEYNRNIWSRSGQNKTYHSFRYGPGGVPINRHFNPLEEQRIAEAILSSPADPRKVFYASPKPKTR